MKREIPLEIIYESEIQNQKLYIKSDIHMLYPKPDFDAAYDIFLTFKTDNKIMSKFIKGDFYYNELDIYGGNIDSGDMNFGEEDDVQFLTDILRDFFYNAPVYTGHILQNFDVLSLSSIKFIGMVNKDKTEFQIMFSNVNGNYDRKSVENKRFLNTLDPSIRDEFGDDIFKM